MSVDVCTSGYLSLSRLTVITRSFLPRSIPLLRLRLQSRRNPANQRRSDLTLPLVLAQLRSRPRHLPAQVSLYAQPHLLVPLPKQLDSPHISIHNGHSEYNPSNPRNCAIVWLTFQSLGIIQRLQASSSAHPTLSHSNFHLALSSEETPSSSALSSSAPSLWKCEPRSSTRFARHILTIS